MAVDSDHVYWGGYDTEAIGRARLDGSEVESDFIPGVPYSCGVAVDGDHVYWSAEGIGIGRARIDGSDADPRFIPLDSFVCGVAVNSDHLYWANGFGGQEVGRSNLDGGALETFVSSWYVAGCGIALDGRVFVPPGPRTSRPARIAKVNHDVSRGTVGVDVWVPARGELAVVPSKLGWKVKEGSPPPWLQGAFRWRLKLWAGKEGTQSKRMRRQLRRSGRARVKLRLSYNETGTLPVYLTRSIVLRKRLKRSVGRHGYRAPGD